MHRITLGSPAVVALLLLGASAAYAGQDHMTFDHGHRVNYYDIQCDIGNQHFNFGGYQTGSLQFHEDGHNTDLFGMGGFDCVCADIPDLINPGQAWDVDFHDSCSQANGLSHGGSIVGWVGDKICGNDLSTLTTDQACGLQLAVWEAIYDTDDPTHMSLNDFEQSLTHGSFKVGTTLSQSIVDCAWNFYSQGYDAGDDCVYLKSSTFGGQDQFKCNPHGPHHFIENTPEPVTTCLGLAGIGLFVKRRKRK